MGYCVIRLPGYGSLVKIGISGVKNGSTKLIVSMHANVSRDFGVLR